MQPPYDLLTMAERAGTGAHAPPPPQPNCCMACGREIDTGRIYCSERACIRKHNTSGKSRERHYEPFPTVGQYSA